MPQYPLEIEVIPNQMALSQPLFKSTEEQRRMEESYVERVTPELERCRIAQLRSWQASLTRVVD
jgi:hypothetical protein